MIFETFKPVAHRLKNSDENSSKLTNGDDYQPMSKTTDAIDNSVTDGRERDSEKIASKA